MPPSPKTSLALQTRLASPWACSGGKKKNPRWRYPSGRLLPG
jgi:hypothetical protein